MLSVSAYVDNFRNFRSEVTERRGRDENRCSGSGLSEHFISGVRDVGRDCRPPREPTAYTTTILRLVHTWLHSAICRRNGLERRHARDTLRASSNTTHKRCLCEPCERLSPSVSRLKIMVIITVATEMSIQMVDIDICKI